MSASGSSALVKAMVENLGPGLAALAEGDFTRHISATTQPEKVTRTDELGQIMVATEHMRDSILECYDAYNRSTEQLRGVIIEVSRAAESVDGTSQQVAESSDQTGRATAEVAHAIEHVANGAERQVQMIATARAAADEVTVGGHRERSPRRANRRGGSPSPRDRPAGRARRRAGGRRDAGGPRVQRSR